MKRLSALLLALIMIFSLSACTQKAVETEAPTTATEAVTTVAETTAAETTAAETKAASDFEPFSVVTFEGKEVTYDHIPEKVVSFNLHTTENLLSLGLGDKIIGKAYNNAEVLPEYKEAFDKIPVLAEKYPALEVVLGAGPDFVYGRSSAFGEKGVASVDSFVENDIMPYVSKATYTSGATMEDTYADYEFLGKLFGVEDKANEIISNMKAQIASVEDKVKDTKRAKVFVFDFGVDDAFTCGRSLESDIISKAGGENVFGNIDKTWVRVSWEEVVAADPEIIVINDYGKTTAAEKIQSLKDNPALADVKAIKNDRFVRFHYQVFSLVLEMATRLLIQLRDSTQKSLMVAQAQLKNLSHLAL